MRLWFCEKKGDDSPACPSNGVRLKNYPQLAAFKSRLNWNPADKENKIIKESHFDNAKAGEAMQRSGWSAN